MNLQFVSVILQGVVTLFFAASLVVGLWNLRLFHQSHQATLLKGIMEDYRRLVDRGVFDAYEQELQNWREKLKDSEFAPVLAYDTNFTAISQIGHFYDHVGLLLRKGLLDFQLCFEVLPVPYKFWEDTKDFRGVMKRVTYSEFWDHFEEVVDRYQAEKSRRVAPMTVVQALRRTSRAWYGGDNAR